MEISELISYLIPSIVTGGVAYYFFNSFLKFNAKEKKIAILSEKKKDSLVIKLQAYERMVLFCDRIHPVKLALRVKPINDNTNSYLHLLIANIDQELEHNLVQQIYISDTSWTAVIAAKVSIINNIKKIAKNATTATELQENIFLEHKTAVPVTDTAISILKTEVRKLL